MKRISAALCLLLLLGGLAHAAFGIFQTYAPGAVSNPNLRQENFYGLTGSAWQNPAGYLVPGAGSPAISTADYYHADGAMRFRPINLLDPACGSAGASIAASNGQFAWTFSADHSDGIPWSDAQDIYLGFSSDPGVPPTKASIAYPRYRLTPLAKSATITAKIDNGSGSAGNILTVTAVTGTINYNNSSAVTGAGVTQATIGGPYTGATPGGVGTYVLSGAAQNVASQSMVVSQINFSLGLGPYLVCNPDDASFPFYLYSEGAAGSSGLEYGLTKSADLVTWIDAVPAFVTQVFSQQYAYQTPRRTGVNTWVSVGNQINFPQTGNLLGFAVSTSIDGTVWTPGSVLTNTCLPPNASGPAGALPCTTTNAIQTDQGTSIIVSGGQNYSAGKSNSTVNGARIGNQWVSRYPVDANYNVLTSPSRVDISKPYSGFYPGQGYMQEVRTYQEDGIVHYYALLGFPPSNGSLNGTAYSRPYLNNGACVQSANGTFGFTGYIDNGAGSAGNTLHVTAMTTTVPVGGQIMFFSGSPAFITAQIATAGGDVATFTIDGGTQLVTSQTISVATCGGLWQQGIDYYTEITDASAAATAAPIGVKASCASSTASLTWFNALPQQTYRLYRGTTAGSQTTLVGDFTGTTATDTGMTLNAVTYYKLVYLHNGVEQKNRVVSTYCSNSIYPEVNAHYTRALAEGADATTCNQAMMDSFYGWLTSNGMKNSLLFAAMPEFCVAKSGSVISKVFDMGTTRLPRGGDYTTQTSNTTYNATGVNSKPAWVNGSTAGGYYGGGRYNTIRRKTQLTLFAVYQKPSTGTFTPFVMGQFTDRLLLSHTSGSPGSINCLIYDGTTQGNVTAAPASATAVNTASCTYDGTNWTAWANATAGTPQTGLVIPSPTMNPSDILTGQIDASGKASPGQLVRVLVSGNSQGMAQLGIGVFASGNESQASVRGQFVFDKAFTSGQQTSFDALVR